MFGTKLIATFDKGDGPIDLELGILKDEDAAADMFSAWLNDNRVRYYMLMSYPATIPQEKDWAKKAAEARDTITWAIYANGILIGSMAVGPLDFAHAHGELGILIGDKSWWGKGVATVAEMLVTDYAFHAIMPEGLAKIYAYVFMGNDPSRKALEHVGFQKVGILRKEHFANGRWFDIWLGDLLKEEWLATAEAKYRSAGVLTHNIFPDCEDVQ